MIEKATSRAIFDLYESLTDDGKCAFLRLLGRTMSVQALCLALDAMPTLQQAEFASMLGRQFIADMLPGLLVDAIRAGREYPQAEEAELAKMVIERQANYRQSVRELAEAELKAARDPKKRNAERDAEIVRLAKLGKTSGEVHRTVKSRWPCTLGAVNQVIMRAKRDGQLPK